MKLAISSGAEVPIAVLVEALPKEELTVATAVGYRGKAKGVAAVPLVKCTGDQEDLEGTFGKRAEVKSRLRGPVKVERTEKLHKEEISVVGNAWGKAVGALVGCAGAESPGGGSVGDGGDVGPKLSQRGKDPEVVKGFVRAHKGGWDNQVFVRDG